MSYDEGLAERIRDALADRSDVSERKMFGGLAFLLNGNMCVGVVGDELMVRVGPDAYGEAVRRPHARKMDFTGRPMKGFVYVGCEGLESDADLRRWVARGIDFARSLPPKQRASRPPSRKPPTKRGGDRR
jgi:TfoX/Sxy family transcriptional regulator of competence genes